MKRHFFKSESSKYLHGPLGPQNSSTDTQVAFNWTPELFGPVFETEKITLWQALRKHSIQRRTKIMASFVPDELIYTIDLTKKNLNTFTAVVLLIDISNCHELWQQFRYMKNYGSYGMSRLFNSQISSIIDEIYLSNGDIINFESHGIMALWKVQKLELIFKTVEVAIKCALTFQEINKNIDNNLYAGIKLKMTISTGNVGFSVIGNEDGRHWVLIGQPVEDIRRLMKNCNPGDIILTENAWEYVSPNNYDYIIMDTNNIKILSEIGTLSRSERKSISYTTGAALSRKISIENNQERVAVMKNLLDPSTNHGNNENFRSSIMEAVSRDLTDKLKSFLMPALVNYIEKDRLLEDICHNRRVTILSINIYPMKCTNSELLNLCDKCFSKLFRLIEEYSGRIESVIAYSKLIYFSIIFGPLIGNVSNTNTNGIICAEKCLNILNNIGKIKKSSIGVSTGVVLYTIVGNSIRHAYFCLGLPIEKSEKIATISNQKISCDFDTVLYSDVSQNCFRLRSIKGITGYGKFHIYQLHNSDWSNEDHWINRNIHEVYPIVGRIDELEKFTDALDGICSSERNYSGFLIDGSDRIGKSRLLDEFVLIARSRQISIHKHSLNSRDSSRSFSTIHQLLLNILMADASDTVEKREKICIKNFGHVSSSRKFCYINALMYVNFTFMQNYLIEDETQRDIKTHHLFNEFLKSIRKPSCIFLDDVHLIDDKSWPFIRDIMNHKNFFLIMTVNSIKCTTMQNNYFNDEKLYKCKLSGLKSDEISLLVCQFLHVHAISKQLYGILKQQNENHPGWCEILISLMLERKWLDFQYSDKKGNIKDLISPQIVSIAKVPYDIFPDEINHDLPDYKQRVVNLNPQNELLMNNYVTLGIVELYRIFFSFLTVYEQDLLKTAAILGDVFLRDTLETVMRDSMDFHTVKAISRLIELRIIECASIQRFDYSISPYVKRSTFSDMHHLIECACYRTSARRDTFKEKHSDLPGYSHCKLLEFKSKAFRQFIYKEIKPTQRKYLHTIVAEYYERQAKKCNSCGGGFFLKSPIISQTSDNIVRMGSIMRQTISSEFGRFKWRKRSDSVGSQETQDAIRDRKISIHVGLDEKTVIYPESSEQKTEEIFNINNDPSQRSQLKKFNMIDFRNCKCEKIIEEIYAELIWHLQQLDDLSKFIKWLIEIAAGLIEICQCIEALKYLEIAKKHNENSSSDEQWENTLIILGLMGDASVGLGKYSDAINYFKHIIQLQKNTKYLDETHKASGRFNRCWRQTLNGNIKISKNEISNRLTIAHYLIKLSKIYLVEGKTKYAENTAMNAFTIGFSCPHEGFIEKCNLYINAIRILRKIGKWKLSRQLEQQMLFEMRKKKLWSTIDEILSVVYVFQIMFELRTLRGEYENAYNIGVKILKISGQLHLTRMTLIILPLLIQLAIRMKRVYQTADLMGQLYYLSIEDIDESSITWYYSLSLDLALDAGMALEPFEKSVEHAKAILNCKNRACVSRDPESLKRLLTCLWIWQLRMGGTVTTIFPQSSTSYTNGITFDSHSQILSLAKGLGCYLLILRRHINIKNSTELPDLLQNIGLLLKTLGILSRHAWFIKPRYFMLKAYFKIIHGDKCAAIKLLKRGRRLAKIQGNQMMIAWLQQSEMTFRMQQYNDMAQYWTEHSSSVDDFNWRNIHEFDVRAWSGVLYPIPVPESCL